MFVPSITVVSLQTARRMCVLGHSYSHAVQILAEGEGTFPNLVPSSRALRFKFKDTELKASDGPNADHIGELIRFGRVLPLDAKVIFHCLAGKSRSVAAAITLVSAWCSDMEPEMVVRLVQARSSDGSPNRAIVAMADALLSMEGKLERASIAWKQQAAAARDPLLGGGWLPIYER